MALESPDIFVKYWFKTYEQKIRGFESFNGKKVIITFKFPEEENKELEGIESEDTDDEFIAT